MIFAGTAYRASQSVSPCCHRRSWLACQSRRVVKECFDTGALLGKLISLSDSLAYHTGLAEVVLDQIFVTV